MACRQKRSAFACLSVIVIMLAVLCFFVPNGLKLQSITNAYYSGDSVPAQSIRFQPYGAGLAGSALIFMITFMFLSGKKQRLSGSLLFFAGALFFGFILSRLVFCLVEYSFYFHTAGITAVFRVADGGYAMTGAFLGILASAWLVSKKEPDFSFRALALSLPVFVLFSRLAEHFSSTGIGPDLDDEMFLSIEGTWGPVLNVYLIEAIAALLILLCMIVFSLISPDSQNDRSLLLLFLILYGGLQIVLESLRQEGHMVWGFVKAQQLTAFAFAGVSAVLLAIRRNKLRIWLTGLSTILLGVMVFVAEKVLDRNYFYWPKEMIYLGFTILILLYIASVFILTKPFQKHRK